MTEWGAVDGATVVAPAVAQSLLERAVAADPANPLLCLKLADLHLDRFDFTAAAPRLEQALRLDPTLPGAAERLARCRNAMGLHHQALEALAARGAAPHFERGIALRGLDLVAEAEAEFRALLAADPGHRHACRMLCKLLRKAGRDDELLETCERLAAAGVDHTQLLYDWGWALAQAGDTPKARSLLFDRARVVECALPVPQGFADIASFNAALAEEILGNPYPISDFPLDEANRGSSRVHSLFAGRRPEIVRQLLDSVQALVESQSVEPLGDFDPWARARPRTAHLKAWGLLQRGGEYEEWHIHRGGWMSGVYYVRVPGLVSAEGEGRGCIEYGAPPAQARRMREFVPEWRYQPREGMVLLAPSHFPHRTIPSGFDEYRISFAFDVVPD